MAGTKALKRRLDNGIGKVIAFFLSGVFAVLWLMADNHGVMNYQTPYRQPQTRVASSLCLPRLPKGPKYAVFILIDGLRADLVPELRCVDYLRQPSQLTRSRASTDGNGSDNGNGDGVAETIVHIVRPSISQPSWTTLVTGAPPEINGACPLNAPIRAIRPISVDTLFYSAHAIGQKTALSGSIWWKPMLAAFPPDQAVYVPGFTAADDSSASTAAIRLYTQKTRPSLLLVYFGEYDEISHQFGSLSPQAHAALRRIDAEVMELLSHIDRADTLVLMTADHGHIRTGGHGGLEPDVINVDLLLAGSGVRQGRYGPIEEEDVAVTVAAALGYPIPRSSMGRPRYELLTASPDITQRAEPLVIAQRQAAAEEYIKAFAPDLYDEWGKRRDHFFNRTSLLEISAACDTARQSGIDQARIGHLYQLTGTLLLVFIGLSLKFFYTWKRRSEHHPTITECTLPAVTSDIRLQRLYIQALIYSISLVAAVATCHFTFLSFGYTYSLSTIGGYGGGTRFLRMLGCCGLGSVAAVLIIDKCICRIANQILPNNKGVFLVDSLLLVNAFFWLQAAYLWLLRPQMGEWALILPNAVFNLWLTLAQQISLSLFSALLTVGSRIAGLRTREL